MNKLFKILAVSGLVLGGATAVRAADLSVLFENTVEMTMVMPGGQEMSSSYKYNEDGTVDILVGDKASSGTWTVNGDEMCMNVPEGPGGQTREVCNPVAEMDGSKPGDSWEFSPAEGMIIKGALVAGR
jgi:hypothetical protein